MSLLMRSMLSEKKNRAVGKSNRQEEPIVSLLEADFECSGFVVQGNIGGYCKNKTLFFKYAKHKQTFLIVQSLLYCLYRFYASDWLHVD